MSTRVRDFFLNVVEFDELLTTAEFQAETDADVRFVEDLIDKFDEFGEELFLSEDQLGWLEDIAGVDRSV